MKMNHRGSTMVRVGLGAVALVASTGCIAGYQPLLGKQELNNEGLGRLVAVREFRMAYETQPACALEKVRTKGPPPEEGWEKADTNTMTAGSYIVRERQYHRTPEGYVDFVALKVESSSGQMMWLRNTPFVDPGKAALAWRCVVDAEWIAGRAPQLKARVVQLAPNAACPALIPISGGQEDVTFAPYTVAGYGVFAGTAPSSAQARDGNQGIVTVGVRLEADAGEKMLTIPAMVFDRCFAPASKPPPPPAEAKALTDWLTGANPDATPPPLVTRETIEGVTGLDAATCIKEGKGATEHLECRRPLLRIMRSPENGPFGPAMLQLMRERFVDAIHLYGGKLVAPTEIISVNAVVRIPKLTGNTGTFARTFQDALRASLQNPDRRLTRGARGFRLLAQSDVVAGLAATHYVDIDLNYQVPDIITTTERRTHRYVAGKKRVHNPARDKAVKEADEARADVPNAESKVQLAETAIREAEERCKNATSQSGMFGQLAGGLACGAASTAGIAAARSAVTTAKERLQKAEAELRNTPEEIDADDERTWDFEAKILQRKGEAAAKVSIAPADKAANVLYSGSIAVPFDASDVEIPNDPEHKLVGKKANPPSVEEVERALAEALIPRIDEAIIKWGAQRQVGGDVGDLRPGTRSWIVAVARRAASDRPIKLLSDMLENRPDQLKQGTLIYPVKLAANSDKRCFTLTAIPTGGAADVNLEFGQAKGAASFLTIAKDARRDPDAALELCEVASGDYAVRVTFGEGEKTATGVAISLFDSTPGAVTNSDTIAATKGLPTVPRKGQEMILNGEGETRIALEGRVVVGRTGDRDGDGIPDENDRCPYDPETVNGYLDQDGCPDEPPPGWKPPTPAPTAPAVAPPAAPGQPTASSPPAPATTPPKPEPAKTDKKRQDKGKPAPTVFVP